MQTHLFSGLHPETCFRWRSASKGYIIHERPHPRKNVLQTVPGLPTGPTAQTLLRPPPPYGTRRPVNGARALARDFEVDTAASRSTYLNVATVRRNKLCPPTTPTHERITGSGRRTIPTSEEPLRILMSGLIPRITVRSKGGIPSRSNVIPGRIFVHKTGIEPMVIEIILTPSSIHHKDDSIIPGVVPTGPSYLSRPTRLRNDCLIKEGREWRTNPETWFYT